MARTIGAPLAAHIATGRTTLAKCLRLDLRDGSSLGFTDHDLDLTVDLGDGPLVYSAGQGLLLSNVSLSVGLKVDNFEANGPVSSVITRPALKGGRFTRARARLFEVNWAATTQVMPMLLGKVGRARIPGGEFSFEVHSLAAAFSQSIGRVLSPLCSHDLGVYVSSGPLRGGCPVVMDPPVWSAALAATARPGPFDALGGTVVAPSVFNGFVYEAETTGVTAGAEPAWPTLEGDQVVDGGVTWTARPARTWPATVTAATDELTFAVSFPAGAPTDGLFTKGLATFLTGELAGTLPVEVFSFAAAGGAVVLYAPAAETPGVGDTLSLSVGCSKLRTLPAGAPAGTTACRDTFRATFSHGGFPESPTSDGYLKYPVPGSSA